uniref:Uncharacterized protein n=1 Tax=Anguilla anguilla TaxID=7936 RepID=A0A0E9SKV4_ANGAN
MGDKPVLLQKRKRKKTASQHKMSSRREKYCTVLKLTFLAMAAWPWTVLTYGV